MSDGDKIDALFSLVERLWLWLLAIVGAVGFAWRHVVGLHRDVLLVRSIRDQFGDDAAIVFREHFSQLLSFRSLAEARHAASEHEIQLGVYICDSSGRCVEANEFLSEMFGIDREDMLRFGWLSAINPEDYTRVHAEWMNSIQNRLPYRRITYRVENRRTESTFQVSTSAFEIRDETNSEVVGYFGIVKKVAGPSE